MQRTTAKGFGKHSPPSLCHDTITPSGGEQTCLCILPCARLEHNDKLIEHFWSYLGIGRKKNMFFFFLSHFPHLNLTQTASNLRCCKTKEREKLLKEMLFNVRTWDNETGYWDKHIYWVCYVSNVTKVECLKNSMCGSFTLFDHTIPPLIQMQ